MLEVANKVDQRITATEVPAAERLSFLPRQFGRHHAAIEMFLRSFAVELCPDYPGGPWRFFETSTGTVFMTPDGVDSLQVCVDTNGFDARVSAEVAGLIVSLFALNRLWMVTRSDEHMRLLVLLRNYALQHPMAMAIYRAID